MQAHTTGIIALDIDGTVTSEIEEIPQEVQQYFSSLFRQGWQFVFLTGRPFDWGFRTLQFLSFPYDFVVQNGASILQMPQKNIIASKKLDRSHLTAMEQVCLSHHTGFVVYGGFENQDICYYCPAQFSSGLRSYIEARAQALGEKWKSLSSFQELPFSSFASLKCFSRKERVEKLAYDIEKQLHLHAPINQDPFNGQYFIVQSTHPQANKGDALQNVLNQKGSKRPIIAAGDDFNDIPMLNEATVKVVMQTAPDPVKKIADIIAPSAAEKGIIQGLEEAIKLLKDRR